jgi:hypothetical protein
VRRRIIVRRAQPATLRVAMRARASRSDAGWDFRTRGALRRLRGRGKQGDIVSG